MKTVALVVGKLLEKLKEFISVSVYGMEWSSWHNFSFFDTFHFFVLSGWKETGGRSDSSRDTF